jgi:hypothetical protein
MWIYIFTYERCGYEQSIETFFISHLSTEKTMYCKHIRQTYKYTNGFTYY